MTAHEVRPWVTALRGHVQLHGAPCPGDCCNFDADQDERAVGDTFSPEWPYKPVRLKPTPGKPCQASAGSALRAHPDARERGPRVSLDGRSALSPSPAPGGSGAGRFSEQLGGQPLNPLARPGSGSSSPLSGSETPSEDSGRSDRHPSGF